MRHVDGLREEGSDKGLSEWFRREMRRPLVAREGETACSGKVQRACRTSIPK